MHVPYIMCVCVCVCVLDCWSEGKPSVIFVCKSTVKYHVYITYDARSVLLTQYCAGDKI